MFVILLMSGYKETDMMKYRQCIVLTQQLRDWLEYEMQVTGLGMSDIVRRALDEYKGRRLEGKSDRFNEFLGEKSDE